MYDRAYKTASELADSIISGTYEKPDLKVNIPATRGLAQRKPKDEGKVVTNQGDIHDDILMQYMVAIRKQNQALKQSLADYTPNSSSGESNSPFTPVNGDVGKAREALASIESSGNYSALGPVVASGSYKGQRAVGRYQVMEGNIGPWTEEILGKRYSTQEFLNDKEAQDKVVEARLQQSFDQYGTWEDAASVWFTGRSMASNDNDSDGYIDANTYVSRFQNAFRRV